jgi:hypothetical protein
MAIVTVSEAIKLSGKAPATFYRHLKTGKVSRATDGSRGIDIAELLRVYGELKDTSQEIGSTPIIPTTENDKEIEWLRNQVEALQQDIKDIKTESRYRETESLDREKRLMALLEYKKESDGGILSKLFK